MSCCSLLIALLLAPIDAVEIRRTHVVGKVVTDPASDFASHITHASWLDETTIVHLTRAGKLVCFDLATNEQKWSIQDVGPVRSMSVSPSTNRVGILLDSSQFGRNDTVVRVLDGDSGDDVFTASSNDVARMVDRPFVVLSQLALSPADGKMLLVHYSSTYGENAYLLNAAYDRVVSRVLIDATVKSVGITEDGSKMVVFAANDVVCVNAFVMNEEFFQVGARIHDESELTLTASDVPFMSGALYDGDQTIVYAIDSPWGTGRLIVEDIETGDQHAIETIDAHIVMDIDRTNRRVAISGTSTNLKIASLAGDDLDLFESASTQRINCVAFSPSGSQVLAGGADGTIAVFRIDE